MNTSYTTITSRTLTYHRKAPRSLVGTVQLCQTVGGMYRRRGLRTLALDYFGLVRRVSAANYLTLSLLGSSNVVTNYRKSLRSVFALLTIGSLAKGSKFVTGPSVVGSHAGRLVLTRYAVNLGRARECVVHGRFRARGNVTVRNLLPAKSIAVVGYNNRYLSRCCLSAKALSRGAGCVGVYHARMHVHVGAPTRCFLGGPLNGRRVLVRKGCRSTLGRFFLTGTYGQARWVGCEGTVQGRSEVRGVGVALSCLCLSLLLYLLDCTALSTRRTFGSSITLVGEGCVGTAINGSGNGRILLERLSAVPPRGRTSSRGMVRLRRLCPVSPGRVGRLVGALRASNS